MGHPVFKTGKKSLRFKTIIKAKPVPYSVWFIISTLHKVCLCSEITFYHTLFRYLFCIAGLSLTNLFPYSCSSLGSFRPQSVLLLRLAAWSAALGIFEHLHNYISGLLWAMQNEQAGTNLSHLWTPKYET